MSAYLEPVSYWLYPLCPNVSMFLWFVFIVAFLSTIPESMTLFNYGRCLFSPKRTTQLFFFYTELKTQRQAIKKREKCHFYSCFPTAFIIDLPIFLMNKTPDVSRYLTAHKWRVSFFITDFWWSFAERPKIHKIDMSRTICRTLRVRKYLSFPWPLPAKHSPSSPKNIWLLVLLHLFNKPCLIWAQIPRHRAKHIITLPGFIAVVYKTAWNLRSQTSFYSIEYI